jgi:lipopolysaccharide biosynthesis glycosyltransferase
MNGFGGVLYPVNTFTDKLFFNRNLFMELSPTSDEMWQYCFNIMDDKQFRTCSTFFDYTNYVIDESQKLDTCLYKVNDSNYQKILNNLINIFPKFKENLLKRTQLSNSCICTITNDDFVEGCITMIYSFLKNNKWFNNDIVILYSDNYSPLSTKSKNKISKIYKNIKYKHIDDSIYNKLVDYSGIPTKFIPPLIKFEIFNLTEYNKVLYIDSDALVINDIYELFIDNTDICFFPHESFHINSLITLEDLHNNRERINNGIILLNNNGISFNNYVNLLYNLNSYNTSDIFYHGTPDQDIMEKTFLLNINDINIKVFPNVYNEIKRKYANKDKLNGNEKIIHYVMKKPWNSNEPEYEFINSIWHKYHNEIINNDNV